MAATDPTWDTSALLLIDVQRDVLDGGATPIAGTSAALPALRRLAAAFRAAGRPGVHVVRLYSPDGAGADLVRRDALAAGLRMLLAGTEGAQIAPGLLPDGAARLDHDLLRARGWQEVGPDEIVLFKPRWSAFFRTPLAAWLADRGVGTVVVAGCNFPNCPRATAVDAVSHDLRAVVVTDATSGATPERVRELAGMGPVPLTTHEVLAQLTAHAAPAAGRRH